MVNAHFGPEVWGRSAAPKEMFVCVCVCLEPLKCPL